MVQSTVSITSSDCLAEEYVAILADEIQKEIDESIMLDMLVEMGWTKVELERLKDRYESIDIELWIDENCKGKHTKLGRTFVFEKKQDAEWFMLKWL
jgi:hypothetical protein